MKHLFTIFAALFLIGASAMASNGMTMIGGGARSSGLAGADVALTDGCPGCNPATLGSGDGASLSLDLGLLHPPVGLRNSVSIPNDVDSENHIYSVPSLEFAYPLGQGSPWTIGLAVRAQGGLGVDFKNAATAFGTRDSFATDFRFARAMPTVAFRARNGMRWGLALVISYADMSSKLFPNTYSPGFDGIPGTPDDFAGMELEGATAVGYAGRLGFLCPINDRLRVGFTYTSETSLDLDGGDLTLDLGFAKVRYDAKIPDFAWPQEAEVGLAFDATPRLLLAADLRWIDWSSTVGELALRGSKPDLPVPLTNPEARFKLLWDDQWVIAVGAEYAITPSSSFRLGYNYGASPVPNAYASPLFPAIVEHHATIGFGHRFERVAVQVAFEHSFAHSQVNDNANPAENPFGPGTEVVAHPGNVLHLGVSYHF